MADKFFVDLGHVVDRGGRNVPTGMRAEQWGSETVYVIVFGESPSGYWLKVLFDYVLRDGLSDFEILREDSEEVVYLIPAGEIRALVRKITGHQNKFGAARVLTRLDVQVYMHELTPKLECPF